MISVRRPNAEVKLRAIGLHRGDERLQIVMVPSEKPRGLGALVSFNATLGFTVQGDFIDQTYSFTALSDGAFPLAKGQVQADWLFNGQRFTVHVTVTCVSVVDNQAWVGSRVKRFVIEGQEQPQNVGTPWSSESTTWAKVTALGYLATSVLRRSRRAGDPDASTLRGGRAATLVSPDAAKAVIGWA